MNITTLTGRAVKDWELKFTSNGIAVANCTIAVQRKFKNAQGSYDADFISLVAWKKTAELLVEYVKKGDQFGISGSIQTRNYENSEGKKVYITEINVNEFDFPNKPKGQVSSEQPTKNKTEPNFEDPFAGTRIEILDSDLPF